MSKPSKKTDATKSEMRTISPEHAERITSADLAALRAEAAVGRGLIELLRQAQGAAGARQAVQAALTKAAMSVGIDPEGGEAWNFDAAERGFVKQ